MFTSFFLWQDKWEEKKDQNFERNKIKFMWMWKEIHIFFYLGFSATLPYYSLDTFIQFGKAEN